MGRDLPNPKCDLDIWRMDVGVTLDSLSLCWALVPWNILALLTLRHVINSAQFYFKHFLLLICKILLIYSSADKDKHHVRPGAPSEPNEYNFNYRRRGVFLIFNNKHFLESTGQLEREGTDADAERLEERFQDTGFEVRRYDDVTYARMTKLMEDSKYQKCSEQINKRIKYTCIVIVALYISKSTGRHAYLSLEKKLHTSGL